MDIEGILNVNDFIRIFGFEELTDSQLTLFNSSNIRGTWLLENLLGWSFSYKELYEERAKNNSAFNCVCPTEEQIEAWEANPESGAYSEPDTVEGQIRLFPYYSLDEKVRIDPCNAVYAVKLVKVLSRDAQQFFTVRELDKKYWMQAPDESGYIRYIEHCSPTFCDACQCDCEGCLMLAVDADWIKNPPSDLTMLLAEIVLQAMKNKPSLSQAIESDIPGYITTINSESVSNHSVSYGHIKVDDDTKSTNYASKIVEDPMYKAILLKYCGPFSPYYQRQHIV